MTMQQIYLAIPILPLLAAAVVGLFGKFLPRAAAHVLTILGVALSFALSVYVLNHAMHSAPYNETVYSWLKTGNFSFEIGFLIDNLSAMMMVVVTFVSLMVHIYTVGYMAEDPGYARFFSYISLFTFAMLMLVMSNNFMQLFFGWEAVGLVSYLLIGFWYTRPTAIYANLKAFLVNRVGDFGFLLGIGLVLMHFGSLDYASVFSLAPQMADVQINLIGSSAWSLMTVTCILLFIGAMGKSAQVPLHVWLPDSMEGPTPISALIHAATMVTAGIFMVARMSPLFELSSTALSFIIVIGSITAFFKALLFLGAGAVIMGMHHDQDIRNMGNLKKYMPVTWLTSLIGSLALIGTPFFAGFYSKDSIIEAVHASNIAGSGFAYFAVLAGVFVTAFYSFRMYFLVFHGAEKWRTPHHDAEHDAHHDDHDHHHGLAPTDDPHEPGWVIKLPLILLAIPSVWIGYVAIEPMLYGDFFNGVIYVDYAAHPAMQEMTHHWHSTMHNATGMAIHGLLSVPFALAASGVLLAWFFYTQRPDIPASIQSKLAWLNKVLENKYGFDAFNDKLFAAGSCLLGHKLWQIGDVTIIDGALVNGTANLIGKAATVVRKLQTGLIYHYAFAMIIGVFLMLTFFTKV
jgi:NADH-quinone oxidoreductase subunit L